MKIDKETKIEIRELVKDQIESRPNSLIEGYKNLYKTLKLFSGILGVFIILNIGLHYIGIDLGFIKEVDFYTILNLVILIFTFLISYLNGLEYKSSFSISKNDWLRKIHSFFIPIHILSVSLILSLFYTLFEPSLIKYIQFSFLFFSFISFFIVILILNIKPKYFTNSSLIYIGEFFTILFKWSLIQFVLFCLMSFENSTGLKDANIVTYISWVSGIVLPTSYEFYKRIKNSKNELNITQRYLLKFIDPNRILCALKSLEELKASEIEGLEAFLKLEKEGDLDKQKALLTYLNSKHNNKAKRIKGFIIACIIFIITAICGSFIQDYIYKPTKEFIEQKLDK